MSIRIPSQSSWGYSQRMVESGGRLRFSDVDTNRGGRISLNELANAVRLNFPGLSDLESKAIAQKAFDGAGGGGFVDKKAWPRAEAVVIREANLTLADKARIADQMAARHDGYDRRVPPAPVPVQPPVEYPYPPPDHRPPKAYQWPVRPAPPKPDASEIEVVKATARTGIGFLKFVPVLGNILNGIDFVRDLGKAMGTFADPRKSLGQKLKVGADLLFHGAGMFVPQIGGAYDVAQGTVRLGKVGAESMMPYLEELPPYRFDPGPYPPQVPMQHALMPPPQPRPIEYPRYQAPVAPPRPKVEAAQQEATRGAARIGIGALKMVPILGNVLNGIDFLRDTGKAVTTWADPNKSFGEKAKVGADLLFHGAGMFVPQIGGAYDIAQGAVRLGKAAADTMDGYVRELPPYHFDPGLYPPVYPMPYAMGGGITAA